MKIFSFKRLIGLAAIYGAIQYARRHGGPKNAFNELLGKAKSAVDEAKTKIQDVADDAMNKAHDVAAKSKVGSHIRPEPTESKTDDTGYSSTSGYSGGSAGSNGMGGNGRRGY